MLFWCRLGAICGRRDDLFHRGRGRDSGRDGLCNRGHNVLIRLCDGRLNYNRVDVATRYKYSVDIGNHCTGMYKALHKTVVQGTLYSNRHLRNQRQACFDRTNSLWGIRYLVTHR